MALGLGVLRLPPAAFWSATPREMAAAAGAIAEETSTPMPPEVLAGLMARFPD